MDLYLSPSVTIMVALASRSMVQWPHPTKIHTKQLLFRGAFVNDWSYVDLSHQMQQFCYRNYSSKNGYHCSKWFLSIISNYTRAQLANARRCVRSFTFSSWVSWFFSCAGSSPAEKFTKLKYVKAKIMNSTDCHGLYGTILSTVAMFAANLTFRRRKGTVLQLIWPLLNGNSF